MGRVSMVSSCKGFKSHPDIVLKDHLRSVGEACKRVLEENGIVDESFLLTAEVVGKTHDFGKYSRYFQDYLNRRGKLGKELRSHAPISAAYAAWTVYRLLKGKSDYASLLASYALLCVHAHHHNLSDSLYNWLELTDLLESITGNNNYLQQLKSIEECVDVISRELEDLSLTDLREFIKEFRTGLRELKKAIIMTQNQQGLTFKDFYNLLLLFSVLIYSDKLQAAGLKRSNQREHLIGKLVDLYKQRRFKESTGQMAAIREAIYRDAMSSLEQLLKSENIPKVITITAPTGSGKTLLGLSTALRLREEVYKRTRLLPRIIYVLPYINIIEQTYDTFADVLRATGFFEGRDPLRLLLKHHHLAPFEKQDGEERPLSEVLLLTESWDSEIVVTTSVQLFETILGTRNRMLKKFHKLCNAILILDEIQTLPLEYWKLIKEALVELTRNFNTYVIMMTATMPLIFKEGAMELVKDARKYFTELGRSMYRYVGRNGMTVSNLAEFAVKTWQEQRSVLVIVNTIPTSIRVYREILDRLNQRRLVRIGVDEQALNDEISHVVAYLSTNIVPKERLRRIRLLRELLHRERKVLVVSTQLVEAGVDLDFDCVIRDIGPIDSIVQAGGRCNREWRKEKGIVYIVRLSEEGRVQDSVKIYGNLAIRNITLPLLEKRWSEFTESELPDLFEEYSDLLLNKFRYDASDKSNNLLNAVRDLELAKVAEFKLLEEEPKIPVFVELDCEAQRVLLEFRRLWDRRQSGRTDFEYWVQLRAARVRLEEYIVETWHSDGLPQQIIAEGVDIRYIPYSEMATYYDTETGLRLEYGPSPTIW